MSDLDTELRVYKARYKETNQFFCDLLGICEDALIKKRKGIRQFTVREAKILADTLGMTLDELYEILPDINHQPT